MKHPLLLACLVCLIPACSLAQDRPSQPADFQHFWRGSLTQLATCPPSPDFHNKILTFCGPRFISCHAIYYRPAQHSSLPPVLYLLDRDRAEEFEPGNDHCWIALDIRQFTPDVQPSIDPARHPLTDATLSATRALALLLNIADADTAGVVGEGLGGAAAIAVAALCPDDTAFLCAGQPTAGDLAPAALPYLDPQAFAAYIAAPTLVGVRYGNRGGQPKDVLELYDRLVTEKDLVELKPARRSGVDDLLDWQQAWQEWAGMVLRLG